MNVIIGITKEIDGYEEVNEDGIEEYVKVVLEEEYKSEKDIYVSILLTDNETIKGVNRDYRNKDCPTDVISFAYLEVEEEFESPYTTLGDIVISLEKVEEQAQEYGHGFNRELYYVLTHGILHLLGYDHIEEDDKIEMRKKEEEILGRHGYTRED
jgi:probable rRNA maturation factor